MRSFAYENSSGIGSKSTTMLSQGITSTPSRWANRALSAPAVFPNGTCFTSEMKSVGSSFSMKAKSDNDQVAEKSRYQARPLTQPVTRRNINAGRKTSGTSYTKTVKIDIPPGYVGSKRRTSVPLMMDGRKWEVKGDESDWMASTNIKNVLPFKHVLFYRKTSTKRFSLNYHPYINIVSHFCYHINFKI